MVCMYMHTVLGIAKCECIKRVVELYETTRLSSYYLKQQLLCSMFVWQGVNLFIIAFEYLLLRAKEGRGGI